MYITVYLFIQYSDLGQLRKLVGYSIPLIPPVHLSIEKEATQCCYLCTHPPYGTSLSLGLSPVLCVQARRWMMTVSDVLDPGILPHHSAPLPSL
jgi:hypothetical protein